jgi:nitroreductase
MVDHNDWILDLDNCGELNNSWWFIMKLRERLFSFMGTMLFSLEKRLARRTESQSMPIMDVIRIRRSVRAYRPEPIPESILTQVTNAMRFAPSACNAQPWRFILVNDSELRSKISSFSRPFLAEAPVIVVACALPQMAYPAMGGYWNSGDVDVAIAVDHLTLAAAAEGLGTCWIGSFNEDGIREILAIPGDVKIVTLTPLGYPADAGMLRPILPIERKSRHQIFSYNRF